MEEDAINVGCPESHLVERIWNPMENEDSDVNLGGYQSSLPLLPVIF